MVVFDDFMAVFRNRSLVLTVVSYRVVAKLPAVFGDSQKYND